MTPTLQVLQNNAAKLVHSSVTEDLEQLGWDNITFDLDF